MSEIVRWSHFSSRTSSCPGDGLSWPKGGSVVILKGRWDWRPVLLQCLSNWMSEWMSEWVIKWRARADNMLTDWQREAQRSASIPPHRPPVVASPAFRAQPCAGLSAWMIASVGKCFIWSNTKGWSANYRKTFKQLTVNALKWRPWMLGFFRSARKNPKILNISFAVYVCCAFKLDRGHSTTTFSLSGWSY